MVISSLIIHFTSEYKTELEAKIASIKGIEPLEHNNGQYAVLIEAPTTDEVAAIAETVRIEPYVNDVQIISHFFEEETLKL